MLGKLPMEVELRKVRDVAQRVDGQFFVEMLVDVIQHAVDASRIVRFLSPCLGLHVCIVARATAGFLTEIALYAAGFGRVANDKPSARAL